MFTVERDIVIARSVEDVFGYVADPRNTPLWRPAVIEVTDVVLPIAVGSAFGEVVRFGGRKTFGMRVTALEPPRRIVMVAESGPSVRPVQTYTFEPVEGGTHLTVRADVHTGGLLSLLQPLLRPQFGRIWTQQLAALKHRLEA